jgi:hypothetical protein
MGALPIACWFSKVVDKVKKKAERQTPLDKRYILESKNSQGTA